MILRSMVVFIIFLAAVWLGLQLQHDPGYVLIAFHQWTIESTLWVAIPLLLVLLAVLYSLLATTRWIMHLPMAWRIWRKKQRIHKAQETTRRGLIEFSEGYWLKAKNHLIAALPHAESPLLNYLTAARAAQELGDNKLRDAYLQEAQQSVPEATIAVELTQAKLQLASQQWQQALVTLNHLRDAIPHHPYVLKLLMHLYQTVNDWPQLIALLPEVKRHAICSAQEFDQLQQQTYWHALQNVILQQNPLAVSNFIKNLPKPLKKDPTLMATYCRYLMANNQDKEAEQVLRSNLHQRLDPELIELYGRIPSQAQLKFTESLLKLYPNSAVLCLCLGRICTNHNLWGKAKTYFEESIKHQPTPAAYAELGQLLEQLEDRSGACKAYRKGLLCALDDQSTASM